MWTKLLILLEFFNILDYWIEDIWFVLYVLALDNMNLQQSVI